MEIILGIFGCYPIRCNRCQTRFRREILWLPNTRYPPCPRCLREDLTDWEEKYFYPPWYKRALLYVGAKAHRCRVCRCNFVSFRRRRAPQKLLSR